MFENFTPRACKVLQLAEKETQQLNHKYLGTEHILLGLIREEVGVAAVLLNNLGIDLQQVRQEVENIVQVEPDMAALGGPEMVTTGQLPQTPRAKRVIEYSVKEARNMNHEVVGTEHLSLGLLLEQDGIAGQVFRNLGLTLVDVWNECVNFMSGLSLLSSPSAYPYPVQDGDSTAACPKRDFPSAVTQALEELEEQIRQRHLEKEQAVVDQDFERALNLRDEANEFQQRRRELLRNWSAEYPFEVSWLSSNDGAVVKIAKTIREERRWDELPVLADALEEAGCQDWEMLDRCRRSEKHRSGCWVVDVVLKNV